MRFAPLSVLPLALLSLSGSGCQTSAPQADATDFFVSNVKPVLQKQCLRCHTGPMAPAGLDLSSGQTALRAQKADGRRFIVPGDPDHSLLVQAVARSGTHPKLMPRLVLSLTDDQIGILREWIEDGAHWPAASAGQLTATANAENP